MTTKQLHKIFCERSDCERLSLSIKEQACWVEGADLADGWKETDTGPVWFCPACREKPLSRPERYYHVYCGNHECSSRLAGKTHWVADSDLGDGEIWLCPDCRPATS